MWEMIFMKNKKTRQTRRALFSSDIETINPENLKLIKEYLTFCKGVDRSDVTILNYQSDLNIFFSWFRDNCGNKDFSEIKKRDYLNFQAHMLSEGTSPNRIRRIRSALSSLSNYVENYLDEEPKWKNFRNIILKIEAPTKTAVREKTILSDEQCNQFLDHLISKRKYQHACAFALAWATGGRIAELVQFKVSDIQEKNIMWGKYYKSAKMRTKGRGKLGKQINRYIRIDKFQKYFDLWMAERERLGVPSTIDNIFVKYDKNLSQWVALEKRTLSSWARTFGNWFGVPFYFHALRHNFCTTLLMEGYPPEIVKQIIAWESLDMVSVYDDRDTDELIADFLNAA